MSTEIRANGALAPVPIISHRLGHWTRSAPEKEQDQVGIISPFADHLCPSSGRVDSPVSFFIFTTLGEHESRILNHRGIGRHRE